MDHSGNRSIQFLCAKRVVSFYDHAHRKLLFDRLVDPEVATEEASVMHFAACKRRLDRILERSPASDAANPPQVKRLLARLANDEGFTIPPCVLASPAGYVGHGSLSALHAAVVLRHYLSSRTQASDAGTINLQHFIQRRMSNKWLVAYIFHNDGGESAAALNAALAPGSRVVVSPYPATFEDDLVCFGPGLVAGFTVHTDCYGGQLCERGIRPKSRLQGKPAGAPIGEQTMLLVGARTDPSSGQRHFVMQLWWKKAQFVEMREDYLVACLAQKHGTVSFVRTPQPPLPPTAS